MKQVRSVQTPDGIAWHVEQFTSASSTPANPTHVVLIPSGEGDCESLVKVANLLADSNPNYLVTTFDMPGFSRSTAPTEAYDIITPPLVAKQIVTLLDSLSIQKANFWGNSSGAGAVLAIIALFPERAICGVIHEPPLVMPPEFLPLTKESDEVILQTCRELFHNMFTEKENDAEQKWNALGDDYFARRDKNFLTWMRHLVSRWEDMSGDLATPENLQKRPIFWTMGTMSDPNIFWANFPKAEAAGLKVRTDVLNCKHFPYVTVPEQNAKWIEECIASVKQ